MWYLKCVYIYFFEETIQFDANKYLRFHSMREQAWGKMSKARDSWVIHLCMSSHIYHSYKPNCQFCADVSRRISRYTIGLDMGPRLWHWLCRSTQSAKTHRPVQAIFETWQPGLVTYMTFDLEECTLHVVPMWWTILPCFFKILPAVQELPTRHKIANGQTDWQQRHNKIHSLWAYNKGNTRIW